MASSAPSLLTIPREIRDQIWELCYIKDSKQDPVTRPHSWDGYSYPHMKSEIYLTNRQLNEEHKDNLSRKDKWVDRVFSDNSSFRSESLEKRVQRDLSYPSLESYVLKFRIGQIIPISKTMRLMTFIVYQMRKQNLNCNKILILDVMTDESHLGSLLRGYSKETGNDWSLLEYEGWFYLKVDVLQFKVVECRGSLAAPPWFDRHVTPALEVDKRAQRALDVLRDKTENEGDNAAAGFVSLYKVCKFLSTE